MEARVMDAPTQALLLDVVRRESCSVLAYMHDAYPWATSREESALAALRRLAADEGRAVAALGEFVVRRRLPPPVPDSYPSGFTTLNFLSLDYLLPRLTEAQQRSVEQLESDLSRATDPDARTELGKLLAAKRRTLDGLESLAGELVSSQ
jgi:hypothetical protein